MADWDASRYHEVSDPQHAWGLPVLERLRPAEGEHILDIGCGTGRLTSRIRARVPRVRVTALDCSPAMLREAATHFRGCAEFVLADAAALPFGTRFDAVFSTATFHWVPDHARLFAEIHRVLRSGGRLVSQAGGGPNLKTLRDRSKSLFPVSPFAEHFTGWREPWQYAGIDDTRRRLESAGFSDIEVSLHAAPTPFPDAEAYAGFVRVVCLRPQMAALPHELRQDFISRLSSMAAADDPPFTLDYWRLNIDARKR